MIADLLRSSCLCSVIILIFAIAIALVLLLSFYQKLIIIHADLFANLKSILRLHCSFFFSCYLSSISLTTA